MKFFKKTAVVFIATAVNFLIAYGIHFFLGRFLGPVEYGKYGVVINLAWINSIPLSALGVSLIKFSAGFNAKKEFGKLKFLLINFLKFSIIMNLIFVLFYLLFSSTLSNYLGGGITNLIWILALSLPLSGIGGILLNFLQGIKKIYQYSLINVISPLSKILFTVILVSLGFGAFGALSSVLITSIVTLLLCLPFVLKYFSYPATKFTFSKIINFGVIIFFANSFFNLILYFDLFFVSSFLGQETAGFYNAAIVLSRSFLMSFSIMAVFFPEFSGDAEIKDIKKLKSNLKWALLYTGIICFIGVLSFWLLPEFIITLTYSQSFLKSVPFLKILSIGYSFFCLFNVLVNVLWSLNKHKLTGILGLFLFIIDITLLYLLVPIGGALAAAYITTGLLGTLFFSSLILTFKFLK